MAKEQQSSRAKPRRRERKNITSGIAHVSASFNNTMITITDAQGNNIAWSSSGSMGFKAGHKANYVSASLITWDMTNCNASAHSLVTLRPATTP